MAEGMKLREVGEILRALGMQKLDQPCSPESDVSSCILYRVYKAGYVIHSLPASVCTEIKEGQYLCIHRIW